MKSKPETSLVKACLDYLHLRGIFAWRVNSGAVKLDKRFVRFQSINGVSDIIGVLDGGRFLAVECKIKPNKLSDDQQDFLASVENAGGMAIVAYTVDDVIEAINGGDGNGEA